MSSEETPPHDLGSAEIGDDGRVSLPTELIDADVLSPSADAYWAYDPPSERVVVTRSRRALQEHADYTRAGSTPVSEEGELELPDEFLEEGDERPWTGRFAGEERCYFDTTVEMLSQMLCFVTTEDQHDSFWND